MGREQDNPHQTAFLRASDTQFTLNGNSHPIFGGAIFGYYDSEAAYANCVAAAVAAGCNMLRFINGSAGHLFWNFDNGGSDGFGFAVVEVSPHVRKLYDLTKVYAKTKAYCPRDLIV